MMWIVFFVIALLVGGILFIAQETHENKKSKKSYLEELEKFVEGKLEPLAERPDSFRIIFKYQGKEFIYEDLEVQGFQESLHKAYLRGKTNSGLTLYATEKEKSTRIRTDIFIASEIPDEPIAEDQKVIIPKGLGDLNIHTNDIELTNALLSDFRMLKIILDFKNTAPGGSSFLSLKVLNGVVILEFYPVSQFKPSLQELKGNISQIENYLMMLIEVMDFIDQKSSGKRGGQP